MKLNILFLLLFSLPSVAAEKSLVLDSANSQLEFNAFGRPSMIKIKGKDGSVVGTLQIQNSKASGSIIADLNQFHTGIDLRDHHMKEKYLETSKPGFQNAKLTISELPLPIAGETKLPFHGILSLHGVEREVIGEADITVNGVAVTGTAHFPIKISEYGINIPSFAGATMAENVDIDVRFQAKIN